MYKNSKHTVLFPLLLAAGVVLGLVLGQYLGRNTTTSQLKGMLSRMALPNNKLSYTLSLIENQYVDSVSMDSLAEHVIPMLVKELDPHSVYIPAAEMQVLNEPLEGEFDGIGVVFNQSGCPIRKSPDQRLFAPTRSLSQLITSFIASESQGIRHAPLLTFSLTDNVWSIYTFSFNFTFFCYIMSKIV